MHWTPKTQVFRGWRYDLQSFRETPFHFERATHLPPEIATLVRGGLLRAVWPDEGDAWTLELFEVDMDRPVGVLAPGDYLTLRTSPRNQHHWAVMNGEDFRDKYCHAQDPNEVPCACCS